MSKNVDIGYFPHIGMGVITAGIYIHVTRIFLGFELLTEKIYTVTADLILTIFIIYIAVCMLLFWKRVDIQSGWRKFFYWFLTIYFWISVPVHAKVQIEQSMASLTSFPSWYSIALLPFLGYMFYFFGTLRIKPENSAPRD